MAKPTSGQMKEFWKLVDSGYIDSLTFQTFLRNPRRYINEQYPVTIDYSKSIEQMIADGQYGWSSDRINGENFSVEGDQIVEIKLEFFRFDGETCISDVRAKLDKLGLRPATIEELLAFGATYPEIQREFTVIAAGSWFVPPYGQRHAQWPCLDRFWSKRRLDLLSNGTYSTARYLAVRK